MHYVNAMRLQNILDISQIETFCKQILQLVLPCFQITETSILHLSYTGLVFINSLITQNIVSIIKAQYNIYEKMEETDIMNDIKVKAPSYHTMLERYKSQNYGGIKLTSVGQLIALSNIKRVIPAIDFKIWIN
jgi:hypothetical protein